MGNVVYYQWTSFLKAFYCQEFYRYQKQFKMVRKLLNDYIVHTLGKICGYTETSSDIMDMFLHSVTVHFCNIFVFSDNKKFTRVKNLQETGWICWLFKSVFCSPSCFCPRQFSSVNLSSSSLSSWWQICHCFSQSCSCFLRAKSVYHDVRGKDLFTCLLLSPLAAQFPASLFCYWESLCHFDQKWIIRKRHSNIRETISVWIRKRICSSQKSSGHHKFKSGGQSLQLWNSGFMLSQE